MSKEWFFKNGPQPYGPYTPEQMRQFVEQGHIKQETLIRKGENGQWVSASRVEGLLPKSADSVAIDEPAKPTKPNSVALKIIAGCLVFLCLVVVWEVIASVLYRNHIQQKIETKEAVNGAFGVYKTETERMEEIKAELEVEGNPYSLFR